MAAPRLPGDPPRGLFWYKGRLRVRRAALIFNLRALTCPEGHKVRVHGYILSESGVQCLHRAYEGADACGAYLLVVGIPRPGNRHWFWAADVTLEELRAAADEGLDEEALIERFGGLFP